MSLPTLNGRWWRAALVTGAITLAMAACGADDQGGLAPLRVVDDEYSPTVLRIPVGGSVRWSFDGTNTHNVVAADFSWRSEEVVARGGSFERTFDVAPAPGSQAGCASPWSEAVPRCGSSCSWPHS